MASDSVLIPRGYLRLFLILLIIQTILLIGIGALTLWINFKMNWMQSGRPDLMFDSVVPLIELVTKVSMHS